MERRQGVLYLKVVITINIMFTKVFQAESRFWNWLVVSSSDPSKVALTVKGLTGTAVGLLAFVVHGPDLSSVPADVYTVILDAFTLFSALLATIGAIRKVWNTIFPPSPSAA
jgi:hypothetical protein